MDREELIELDKEILADTILSLRKSVAELSKNNDLLLEALKLSKQRKYGKKSEVNEEDILTLDLFFNEAEALSQEEAKEPALEEAAPKRRKTRGKKENDFAKITDHREEKIELSEKELDSLFGKDNYRRLPDEIIQKLEHIPARFEAVTYKIAVYCAKDETKCSASIVRAKAPEDPFPKSIATPSLVSSIITAKYVNALPLYRQEKAFAENNIFLDRTNMANWVIRAYERYFFKMEEGMKKELLKSDIIHADETVVRCSKDCKTRNNNYMWVYHTSDRAERNKVTLFSYEKDRSAEHPKDYLKGYEGVLVCDGYSAYKSLEDKITVAGCWVHAKRKFAEYVKALGKDKAKGTLAKEAENRISALFHEEHKLKDLTQEEKKKKRKEILEPMVNDFFSWIRKNRDLVPLKSATGKAFTYCLNQEAYLRTFLEDPDIPLENNAAERSIRPFTIGRKNWVMIDTPKGAKASAFIYSLIETAKLYDLNLYEYIRYLLEELPRYEKESSCPESLFPWSDQLPKKLFKTKQ